MPFLGLLRYVPNATAARRAENTAWTFRMRQAAEHAMERSEHERVQLMGHIGRQLEHSAREADLVVQQTSAKIRALNEHIVRGVGEQAEAFLRSHPAPAPPPATLGTMVGDTSIGAHDSWPEGADEQTAALGGARQTTVPTPDLAPAPPSDYHLTHGTPEGEATLGRLSRIATEQTPGGSLIRGATDYAQEVGRSAERLATTDAIPRTVESIGNVLAEGAVSDYTRPAVGTIGSARQLREEGKLPDLATGREVAQIAQTAGDVLNVLPHPGAQAGNAAYYELRSIFRDAGGADWLAGQLTSRGMDAETAQFVARDVAPLIAQGGLEALGTIATKHGARLTATIADALGPVGDSAPASRFTIRGAPDGPPAPPLSEWAAVSVREALTDPVKRETLLRAAAGNPTAAEATAGKVGTVAGTVGGAATADEDATWQERVSRGALGALAGSQVGTRFPRLVDAITAAAREAGESGRLGIMAGAAGDAIKLSPAGETERARLIAENVKLGIPEAAATGMVNDLVAKLYAEAKVPPEYLASATDLRTAAAEAVAPASPPREAGTPASAGMPKEPSRWDQAAALANRVRYSGMLSSPLGGLRDTIANSLSIPVTYSRVVQAALMEGAGQALGKIHPEERSAVAAELHAMNAGLSSGVVQGMKEALGVMLQGGKSYRFEQPVGLVTGPKGLLLETGQRLRIASDALFTHIGESMAINALAIREASREGLQRGPKMAERAATLAAGIKQRLAKGNVEQLGTLPTKGMSDEQKIDQLAGEAMAWGKRGVFQAELGTTAGAIEKMRGTPITKFFIPFYRTLSNIGAQAVTMTPGVGQAGLAADLVRGSLAKGSKFEGPYAAGNRFTSSSSAAVLPASQRLADANLGLLVAATGGALVANGLMTGAPPKDQRLRTAWFDAGNRPYTLRMGDEQVPVVNLLGPLALPLVFGASLMSEVERNGATVDEKMLAEFANNVQAEWFRVSGLESLYDLLGNLKAGAFSREAQRYLARQVSSFIPESGLLRAIANASDDTRRAPQTLLDYIKEGLPAVREQLPEDRDEFGQPVLRPSGERGAGAFSPIQASRVRDGVSGLDREIVRAKRDAQAALESTDEYRSATPDQQAKMRTSTSQRVSAQFTDRRKAAVTETLTGDASMPAPSPEPRSTPAAPARPTATPRPPISQASSAEIAAAIRAVTGYKTGRLKTKPTRRQEDLYEKYAAR